MANGFLNRSSSPWSGACGYCPKAATPTRSKDSGLVRYLATVLGHAQTAGQLKLDPAARELWWHTYPQLTQPADGLAGNLTARAEAHTIRLALLYALLDGLTRTQLRDLTHRNATTTQLDQALAALAHDAKITSHRVITNFGVRQHLARRTRTLKPLTRDMQMRDRHDAGHQCPVAPRSIGRTGRPARPRTQDTASPARPPDRSSRAPPLTVDESDALRARDNVAETPARTQVRRGLSIS